MSHMVADTKCFQFLQQKNVWEGRHQTVLFRVALQRYNAALETLRAENYPDGSLVKYQDSNREL